MLWVRIKYSMCDLICDIISCCFQAATWVKSTYMTNYDWKLEKKENIEIKEILHNSGVPRYSVISTLCKISFSVSIWGYKGLENNFGPSVKLSDKKIQNGRQNPSWLPISSFLSHYPS